MIVGCVLLALAALVALAGAGCWLAGVQLMALVKIALGVCAVGLTAAGTVVVSADLLTSAGYLDFGRGDPNKQGEVTVNADLVSEEEGQRLARLHRNAVETFIDRPNFGMRRLSLPLDDIVMHPSSRPENDDVWRGPIGGLDQDPAKAKNVHHGVQDHLGKWGMDRVPTKRETEDWKVKQVHLVGLVKNPAPVVYLTDRLPDMKEMKDVPTRKLDAFEESALTSLRGGENLKIVQTGKELRMMGPIFAGARCVQCHEKKGELLGAFTYRLERGPAEKRE